MSGFIGPLDAGDDFDGRCPACANDPYDTTCHHPDCPIICARMDRHRCPQTDVDLAERFCRIWGITSPLDLPTPPIPESWKISERLVAWDQGREPVDWARRVEPPARLVSVLSALGKTD